MRVRDADTLAVLLSLPCGEAAVTHARWSPDGAYVLGVPRGGANALVWSADDGALFTTVTDVAAVAHARWAPDSRHLLMCAPGARSHAAPVRTLQCSVAHRTHAAPRGR